MNKINIKDWYQNTFPTDELGSEIKDDIMFNDLFDVLNDCKDVYELLGVYDSVIRERVFEKLSQILNVNYTYIYNQWLRG